jgi:hypothetical protein
MPEQGCEKSMKEEEQRMNSPKLGRRQWSGGERAGEDPIPQQCCKEKMRRRRRRRERRASSSVGAGVEQDDGGAPSLFFGPATKRKKQRSGGRRRHCGGKKSKFTPTPIFIPKDQGRGDRGECSTTPTISAGGRHVAARSGAAVPVTEPLGHDGLQ